MSRITKTFFKDAVSARPDTINHEGYAAFSSTLREIYLQMLLTNTLGNTFYVSAKDSTSESIKLHEEFSKSIEASGNGWGMSIRFWGNALVFARNRGYMRSQPIIGLAYFLTNPFSLNMNDPEFLYKVFAGVIRTPKDLSDFTVVLKGLTGGEGGRLIKRLASRWFVEKLSEYWAIKYGADNDNKGYTLKDLIRVYHPKFGRKDSTVDYLLGGTAYKELDSQIKYFESLKSAKTEDEKISAISKGRLPHEVATTFAGNSKRVWASIVEQLPIFALIKNLATLERHGVAGEYLSYIESTLTNPSIIARSKIFPFRFLDAMNHVSNLRIKDALKRSVDLAFGNLPGIKGVTTVALDVSGSMAGNTILTEAIFAISLMRKTDLSGKFYKFNTRASELAVSKVDSILSQAGSISAGGGTDTGSFLRDMLTNNYYCDNIILITDEEQNAGVPLYKLLEEYRAKINRNVKVFIVNVNQYHAHLAPTNQKGVYYVYGWSDEVLEYISILSEGTKTLSQMLEE